MASPGSGKSTDGEQTKDSDSAGTTQIGEEGARSDGPTSNVDLNADTSLLIDISDALSERDKVKFTVHTKSTMSEFKKTEFSVVRQHEEFIWLHDRFEEDEEYAGCIIPPAPPRPDFDSSREKLQRLGEAEQTLTHDEFIKMKNELEQEYLATFKKTVAMHEVFLQRLAAHPSFRKNLNFHVFLEYEGDLSVRNKNRQEKLGSFIRNISKSADELLLSSTTKDNDEYFEKQKAFMLEYHNRLRDATARADRLSRAHKSVADSLISISAQCLRLVECLPELEGFLTRSSEYFEKSRKIENRVSSDMDLKLSDSLRYYVRDTEAAKTLLYKRFRSLADLNEANKKMERARVKGREVPQAEGAQKYAQDKFDKITGTARGELADFHARRVPYFHKNLTALADLQYKHAKTHIQLLKQTLQSLKEA